MRPRRHPCSGSPWAMAPGLTSRTTIRHAAPRPPPDEVPVPLRALGQRPEGRQRLLHTTGSVPLMGGRQHGRGAVQKVRRVQRGQGRGTDAPPPGSTACGRGTAGTAGPGGGAGIGAASVLRARAGPEGRDCHGAGRPPLGHPLCVPSPPPPSGPTHTAVARFASEQTRRGLQTPRPPMSPNLFQTFTHVCP